VDYRFKIAAAAKRDLRNIWLHIARDNPAKATSFREELFDQAKSLQFFPHRNIAMAKPPEVRKLAYKSYLIFYRVESSNHRVVVLRFWHGARDQDRLRLKEEAALYPAPLAPLATA
jgi:toxin ParE1/3/4